SRCPVSFCV
ncbi:hypothetical protein CP061683_0178B, partial [Chlamydia psittaci 06-1683]